MIVTIVQARMSSTRLRGKVLLPILGRPMLQHQLERLQRCRASDSLMVATSEERGDDAIGQLCRSLNVPCFRGQLNDVLDRYYQAAMSVGATGIVRITADCPLIDPAVADDIIGLYRRAQCDYASNTLVPTYPDGLDVEVVSMKALQAAWRDSAAPSEREHVTSYVWQHPDRFRLVNHTHSEDLSHHRWTVDEPEDLDFVRSVYQALYDRKPDFDMYDVLRLLRMRPELELPNRWFERNERYLAQKRAEDEERAV